MKERFAYRSGYILAFLLFAVLCTPTEQRSRCQSSSSADCGENALGPGEEQPRGFYSKYMSAVDDPVAIKQLMEQLLMQHNQFAGDSSSATEEEENSTERPPIRADGEHQMADDSATKHNDIEENTTEKPPLYDRVQILIPSTTPQPPITNALTDVLNQLKQELQTADNEEESVWEITTIHPQQLSSPLDVHEHHFEATTLPPPLIPKPAKAQNSTPVDSSDLINIPPLSKKPKKPSQTKRPHIIHQPQQLDSFTKVSPVNVEKITTKPDEQTSQLTPVDRDQDSGSEIQLEILNRPISTRQPPGRANRTQTPTSSRPRNKKPINIIPESPVKNKRKPPPPQGSSGGVHKPTRKPVAAAPLSESDDYLISALASIDDDEENYVDGEDDDESFQEDNEDEDEDEDEEEDDYQADNSAEERENLADASDVISSVMEEVAALL